MKVVGPIVGEEAVPVAVQGEGGAAYPVGHAADGGADIGVLPLIAGHIVKAQHHVRQAALAVRHPQGLERGTVVDHHGPHPAAVFQRVGPDGLPLGGISEASALRCHIPHLHHFSL